MIANTAKGEGRFDATSKHVATGTMNTQGYTKRWEIDATTKHDIICSISNPT